MTKIYRHTLLLTILSLNGHIQSRFHTLYRYAQSDIHLLHPACRALNPKARALYRRSNRYRLGRQ
jgi:hypothetical protein